MTGMPGFGGKPTRGLRCTRCHKAHFLEGSISIPACECGAAYEPVWMGPKDQGKVVD